MVDAPEQSGTTRAQSQSLQVYYLRTANGGLGLCLRISGTVPLYATDSTNGAEAVRPKTGRLVAPRTYVYHISILPFHFGSNKQVPKVS